MYMQQCVLRCICIWLHCMCIHGLFFVCAGGSDQCCKHTGSVCWGEQVDVLRLNHLHDGWLQVNLFEPLRWTFRLNEERGEDVKQQNKHQWTSTRRTMWSVLVHRKVLQEDSGVLQHAGDSLVFSLDVFIIRTALWNLKDTKLETAGVRGHGSDVNDVERELMNSVWRMNPSIVKDVEEDERSKLTEV